VDRGSHGRSKRERAKKEEEDDEKVIEKSTERTSFFSTVVRNGKQRRNMLRSIRVDRKLLMRCLAPLPFSADLTRRFPRSSLIIIVHQPELRQWFSRRLASLKLCVLREGARWLRDASERIWDGEKGTGNCCEKEN
jgi:hypothetical protein